MGNFFRFLMDPNFSEGFIEKFSWMGNVGIVLLVFLKIFIMLIGTSIFIAPFLPILFRFAHSMFLSSLSAKERRDYLAQKRLQKYNFSNHR